MIRWSISRRLPLRGILALWSGVWLLTLSVILVAFINVVSTVTIHHKGDLPYLLPQASPASQPGSTVPPEGQNEPNTPVIASDQTLQIERAVRGRLSPTVPTVTTADPAVVRHVQTGTLREVRIVSILGLVIVSVVGGVGAYWLAGRALRPLREVSLTAQQISVSSLNTRLAMGGPEDDLKRLADVFDAMMGRLEEAFERQSRFVADAAHELRTPLASLRVNTEVLLSNTDASVHDYREAFNAVNRALTRLDRLVDDLLILATEERHISTEEITLGALLEEVLSDLTPLAREHHVTLRLSGDGSAAIQGRAELVARVFSNLIENGIRYNRPEGEVTVTVDQGSSWVVTKISDTGIGLLPMQKTLIFERFYRTDHSRSRHKGGVGIGLSIVAHIVRQYGGQIEVESSLGEGSSFTVKWPMNHP